jgi:F-type H+-transporting ATPase subunit b
MRATLSRTLAVLAATVVPASTAAAQEAGEKVNILAPKAGLMIWTLLIFGMLFLILRRFVFPPLTEAVRQREQALEDAIAAAKRDREEASRLLEEQRQQIADARNEAQRYIAEGRATGEKLRQDLLEQGHQQTADLLERARRDIQAEKERAIADLRREAVDLAIAGASRVIERNLDDQANRRLVEGFLQSLDANKVGSAGAAIAAGTPRAGR